MSKRPVQQQLLRVLALSLIIALIGGGVAMLSQWRQPTPLSHAASNDSVVGAPSLPAATVDSIFRQLGSPMVGTGQAVEAASRAANIDDAFALAVWWTETNDGAAGVGRADRNPGSVRGSIGYPSAFDGYTIYPSYTAAVNYWFPMLQKVYINRGLTTVTAISHPYVGTSTSYLWAGKVITLMQRYRAEAPPPPPATPTVSASMKHVAQVVQQQAQAWSEPSVVVQQPQSTQTNTQASGLSASTERLLVLFNLLLALALGLWAWSLNRRAVSSPKPVVQPVSNIWEQLQASNQQPAAFFRQQSLSGLPITEGLSAGLPNTGQLVANAPRTGLFAAHTPNSGQFATSVPGASTFAAHTPGADRFAANVPGSDMFAANTSRQPAYSGPNLHSSLRSFATNRPTQTPQPTQAFAGQFSPAFTGQLSSFDASISSSTDQLPFETVTGQLPFEAAIAALSNQRSFDAPAYPQSAPTPNSPYRTFQPSQPAAGYPWPSAEQQPSSGWQPQPVGVGAGTGRSNGLLSRYREMQAQGQR